MSQAGGPLDRTPISSARPPARGTDCEHRHTFTYMAQERWLGRARRVVVSGPLLQGLAVGHEASVSMDLRGAMPSKLDMPPSIALFRVLKEKLEVSCHQVSFRSHAGLRCVSALLW